MGEPVSTAVAASTVAGAAAPAAVATPVASATPAATSGGSWFGDTIGSYIAAPFQAVWNVVTAPFQAVGSVLMAPVSFITSLPGKFIGGLGGATKGAISFSNVPVALAVAGIETLYTFAAPQSVRDLRVAVLGEDEATATRKVDEAIKGGVTGIALPALGHGALVAMGLGAAAGASEGAGGGLTGLAAGAAVVTGGMVAAGTLLHPSKTPAGSSGGKAENALV